MKTLLTLLAAAGLVAGAALGQAMSSPPARAGLNAEQSQWLTKGHRHEKAGWIYLHIEGEPRERGFQHGYLLAKEIAESLRIRRAVWYHNTALEWADLLKETARTRRLAAKLGSRIFLAGVFPISVSPFSASLRHDLRPSPV